MFRFDGLAARSQTLPLQAFEECSWPAHDLRVKHLQNRWALEKRRRLQPVVEVRGKRPAPGANAEIQPSTGLMLLGPVRAVSECTVPG
jgi:hypothetical protein